MRGGAETSAALAAGVIELGVGGHLQTAEARLAGHDQVFVCGLGFEQPPEHLVVHVVGSASMSLGSLAGARVGVTARGAISDLQLRLAVSGEVELEVMPFTEMAGALAAGRVDAVSIVEPFASQLLAGGSGRLLSSGSLASALPNGQRALIAGVIGARAWLNSHAEEVAAFVKAIAQAAARLSVDADAARTMIATYTRTPYSGALPLFDAATSAADLQLVYDLAQQHGLLPHHVDADEVLYVA